jgi:hypothetical protein
MPAAGPLPPDPKILYIFVVDELPTNDYSASPLIFGQINLAKFMLGSCNQLFLLNNYAPGHNVTQFVPYFAPESQKICQPSNLCYCIVMQSL